MGLAYLPNVTVNPMHFSRSVAAHPRLAWDYENIMQVPHGVHGLGIKPHCTTATSTKNVHIFKLSCMRAPHRNHATQPTAFVSCHGRPQSHRLLAYPVIWTVACLPSASSRKTSNVFLHHGSLLPGPPPRQPMFSGSLLCLFASTTRPRTGPWI